MASLSENIEQATLMMCSFFDDHRNRTAVRAVLKNIFEDAGDGSIKLPKPDSNALRISFIVASHDNELQTIEVMREAFSQVELTGEESGRVQGFMAGFMRQCTADRFLKEGGQP